jgi:hypothetical protein
MTQYIMLRGDLEAGFTAFGLYTKKEVDEVEEDPGGTLHALRPAGYTFGDMILVVGTIRGFSFYGPFNSLAELHWWRGDRWDREWGVMYIPRKVPLI